MRLTVPEVVKRLIAEPIVELMVVGAVNASTLKGNTSNAMKPNVNEPMSTLELRVVMLVFIVYLILLVIFSIVELVAPI